MTTLGSIIIGLGLLITFLGVFGTFRFREFYSRVLICSKVDTVGYITILIGVILRSGFDLFTFKVLLILIISFITIPLTTHAITRSAFKSGFQVIKEDQQC